MQQKGSRSRVSSEFIEKLKSAINLVDVVSEVVVLKKSGANYTGLCPFHGERTPSFSVSEQKQLYHCYGCKAGGDLFEFMKQLHGLSFNEVLEELAERARVPLPQNWDTDEKDPEAARRKAEFRDKLSRAYRLNRFSLNFFQQELHRPAQAHLHRYFVQRGTVGYIARNFFAGAAPVGWDGLARHLVAGQAPLDLAQELGLIRPSPAGRRSSDGVGYYDLFRNRAMFPIIDLRGKVAGFGGRHVPLPSGGTGDASGATESDPPKYVNSSASLTYQKEKLAFGLYQAAKHIREKDCAILVEGYFDVVSLHAAGFKNVIATCGTALTLEHLKLLRRLASKLIVLFDSDKGGRSGTLNAMETGLSEGWVLYGAELPQGADPDELVIDQQSGAIIPSGVEHLKEILARSEPLLDQRISEQVKLGRQGSEAQTQAIRQVAQWLNRYKDPVGREVRAQNFCQALGVPRGLLDRAGVPVAPGGSVSIRSSSGLPVSSIRSEGAMHSAGRGGGALPSGRGSQVGSGSGAGRSQKVSGVAGVNPVDRILLQALALGGEFVQKVTQARVALGPEVHIFDLFDGQAPKDFTRSLVREPGYLERFRSAPDLALNEVEDSQVRSILTEALLAKEPLFQDQDFEQALRRASIRALERISQRIRTAMANAEATKNADLEARLKQEYLDVQRRIKEFGNFYDEA